MPLVLLSAKIDADLKHKLITEAKGAYEGNISLALRRILKCHYGLLPKSKNGKRR